ncbi:MAG: amidohydrolase family protein [Anaerolineae bacterium]|nr:amidohydrolase family protein [Anaerolineae bacterium]
MDSQFHVHRPGTIILQDGRIREVLAGVESDPSDAQVLDWSDRVVMPGLVNAHTHTPMVLFRGLAEGHSLLTLDGWYNAIRSWEHFLTPEMIAPAVAVSCAEMVRTGTTCFADHYFFMDRIVPVVEQSGLRAALAYGIVELGDAQAGARALQETMTFLQQLRDHPRLGGWIGPHAFFVDNAAETMQAELELADQFKTGLHIHLATSGEEDEYCRRHFGRTAVQQMKTLGALDRRMLAAHCLTIPPQDFSTLAAAPFTAVMAPSACMRAGAAAAPLKAMRHAGINTALGTDNVANNNSYDLFQEMRILGKLMSFREQEPTAIPARDIVEMATLGGARALGLEREIGSLEPGKRADLIALDANAMGWTPRAAQDPYTALVYAVSGLDVRDAMVDGKFLLRDGKLESLDYREACVSLEAAYAELRARRDFEIENGANNVRVSI